MSRTPDLPARVAANRDRVREQRARLEQAHARAHAAGVRGEAARDLAQVVRSWSVSRRPPPGAQLPGTPVRVRRGDEVVDAVLIGWTEYDVLVRIGTEAVRVPAEAVVAPPA